MKRYTCSSRFLRVLCPLWIQLQPGRYIRRGSSRNGQHKGSCTVCTFFVCFAGCGCGFPGRGPTAGILLFGESPRLMKKSPRFVISGASHTVEADQTIDGQSIEPLVVHGWHSGKSKMEIRRGARDVREAGCCIQSAGFLAQAQASGMTVEEYALAMVEGAVLTETQGALSPDERVASLDYNF